MFVPVGGGFRTRVMHRRASGLAGIPATPGRKMRPTNLQGRALYDEGAPAGSQAVTGGSMQVLKALKRGGVSRAPLLLESPQGPGPGLTPEQVALLPCR